MESFQEIDKAINVFQTLKFLVKSKPEHQGLGDSLR